MIETTLHKLNEQQSKKNYAAYVKWKREQW